MRPRQAVPLGVAQLLSEQAGTITRSQAQGCGLSEKALRRLVRDECWTRTAAGVYLRGVGEPTFEQRLWTGIHLSGEPAAIGGAAALHHRGVGPRPDTITVVVPAAARRRLPLEYEALRDGRGRLAHARGCLPLVRVEDALLDNAPGQRLEAFVGSVTDAVRLRLTTAKQVERVLRERERERRAGELLEVLADLQGIESNLEYVFRRDVLRAHGLPEGRRQARTGRGRRIDVYYDDFWIIVELDGRRGHVDGRFRDHARDNEHSAALRTTFRFGSYDVRENACALAAQLGNAFVLRGWDGEPGFCEQCPRP